MLGKIIHLFRFWKLRYLNRPDDIVHADKMLKKAILHIHKNLDLQAAFDCIGNESIHGVQPFLYLAMAEFLGKHWEAVSAERMMQEGGKDNE